MWHVIIGVRFTDLSHQIRVFGSLEPHNLSKFPGQTTPETYIGSHHDTLLEKDEFIWWVNVAKYAKQSQPMLNWHILDINFKRGSYGFLGTKPWSPTNHWLNYHLSSTVRYICNMIYLRIICQAPGNRDSLNCLDCGHPRKWSVHLPMHWTQGEVWIKSKHFGFCVMDIGYGVPAYQQRYVWSHRMLPFLIWKTFSCIGCGKNLTVLM